MAEAPVISLLLLVTIVRGGNDGLGFCLGLLQRAKMGLMLLLSVISRAPMAVLAEKFM